MFFLLAKKNIKKKEKKQKAPERDKKEEEGLKIKTDKRKGVKENEGRKKEK